MKPNEPDDPLKDVLRSWDVRDRLPPRFQEQVWNRITQAEAKTDFRGAIMHLLDRAFARPALPFAYVSALLILGLIIGGWHARVRTERIEDMLQTRYVQAVDPYQTPRGP